MVDPPLRGCRPSLSPLAWWQRGSSTPSAARLSVDRGWLRSGSFLYQPANDRTCCPNLAIRLDITRYRPSKSQIRVARRLHRFCSGPRAVVVSHASAKSQRAPQNVSSPEVARLHASLLETIRSVNLSVGSGGSVRVADLPGWENNVFRVRAVGWCFGCGPRVHAVSRSCRDPRLPLLANKALTPRPTFHS